MWLSTWYVVFFYLKKKFNYFLADTSRENVVLLEVNFQILLASSELTFLIGFAMHRTVGRKLKYFISVAYRKIVKNQCQSCFPTSIHCLLVLYFSLISTSCSLPFSGVKLSVSWTSDGFEQGAFFEEWGMWLYVETICNERW